MGWLTSTHGGGVSDLDFHIADRKKLSDEACEIAIEDARIKSKSYAEGLGRQLGETLIIEEARISDFRLKPTLREAVATGRALYKYESIMVTARKREREYIPVLPSAVEVEVKIYAKHALR